MIAEPSTAEQLAARARDGHRPAFDELVSRYRAQLVAFLAQRLPVAGDAEDVAQETFLRAYDHLDRYDPTRPFGTWLFAIGKNLAVNHTQARTRRAGYEHASAGTATSEAPAAESPDLWKRAAELLAADSYRMMYLRYADGLSVKEIATALGRSSVAVKVALFRARRRLAEEMR